MAASVPERCPQCRSPVAERFPHAVMYDCGFSLFNDGQPVTDDYPAECQRRRIKRLEKQLAAARAEAERWKQQYEALRVEMERLQGALNISPDDVGRIMHESWSRTKRSQGFHHPSECPNGRWVETAHGRAPCPKCHADLIPWGNLPEPQKDINRHAFDDVLAEIRRRAAIAERGGESG